MDEKSRKTSLKVMMIGLVAASLVVVGLAATIVGATNLRRGMEDEVETGVMAACISYAQVLNYTREHIDKDATLEADMSKETGYDYTFFLGDTRERSSIPGVVGTKAGDAVIQHVINGKQAYQAQNVVINGEKYYVAYEPLEDENGVYGMAFVGKKKVEITAYISKRVAWTVTIAFAIVIAFTTLAVLYVLKIVEAIDENVRAVRQMATGDLDIQLSDKVRNRSDELGEMSTALFEKIGRAHV